MRSIVARRLLFLPVIAFVVASIVFLVLRLIPGNAADVLAMQATSPDERQRIAAELGLDGTLLEQYGAFLLGVVTLDPGVSFYSGRSVRSLLVQTMPVTIELALASLVIMVVLGISLGAIAAAFRGRWVDTGARMFATLFFSMPWFWLGVLLIVIFGVYLRWLPTFGRLPPGLPYEPTTNFVLVDAFLQRRFDLVWPWLSHLLLPALAVGLTASGFIARITRASFIEKLSDDFVRTARMKGMSERRVFFRHVFRNAALPIVTIAGLQFGALLGGAVVSEVVFSYPGVGRLLVDAIFQRDLPVVEGAALLIAFLYILVNTLTDVSYTYLDPRLRR